MSDEELRERTMQYLNRVLDPAPGSLEIRRAFEDRVRSECEAVMRSSPDRLIEEEAWLDRLMHDAEVRFRRAAETLTSSAELIERDQWDLAAQREFRQAQEDLADARLRLSLAAAFNARVAVCIETQRGWINHSELVLNGSWRADNCNAAPGITPNRIGRLRIEVMAEGHVKGVVYPTDSEVGVEVEGQLQADRSFVLNTKSGRSPVVKVEGRIHEPYPLQASGTFWMGSEVTNYGSWSCWGSWSSP
jgi:hypothetical protein